eukprot:1559064-Prorocentrum_lima.AAC.1
MVIDPAYGVIHPTTQVQSEGAIALPRVQSASQGEVVGEVQDPPLGDSVIGPPYHQRLNPA